MCRWPRHVPWATTFFFLFLCVSSLHPIQVHFLPATVGTYFAGATGEGGATSSPRPPALTQVCTFLGEQAALAVTHKAQGREAAALVATSTHLARCGAPSCGPREAPASFSARRGLLAALLSHPGLLADVLRDTGKAHGAVVDAALLRVVGSAVPLLGLGLDNEPVRARTRVYQQPICCCHPQCLFVC